MSEAAARELGRLSLIDGLSLVVLYAATGSPKFDAAAVRWLTRLALEGRDVDIGDLQLAAVALGALKGRRRDWAERTLLGLV